jgi:hypothetical protein
VVRAAQSARLDPQQAVVVADLRHRQFPRLEAPWRLQHQRLGVSHSRTVRDNWQPRFNWQRQSEFS